MACNRTESIVFKVIIPKICFLTQTRTLIKESWEVYVFNEVSKIPTKLSSRRKVDVFT